MWTFVEPLCSKRPANFVYSITYVLLHRQRNENKVWSALAFLSALMLARKLSAAAKSNVWTSLDQFGTYRATQLTG